MSNNLLDLRFIIGVFFLVMGVILLLALTVYTEATPSGFSGRAINGTVGGGFILFGLLMAGLRKRS